MVHDIYKYAVNSMTYMVMKEAQLSQSQSGFYEELMEWVMTIQPETDPEVLAYISECAEQELREWSDGARDNLLAQLAAYLGEGYEEDMFFHIIKRVLTKIKEEDDDYTSSSQNEPTT